MRPPKPTEKIEIPVGNAVAEGPTKARPPPDEIHRAADPNKLSGLEEKHVPQFVVPRDMKLGTPAGITVNIGKVPTPWSLTTGFSGSLYMDGKLIKRVTLKPGDKPMAEFTVSPSGRNEGLLLCNLHSGGEHDVH